MNSIATKNVILMATMISPLLFSACGGGGSSSDQSSTPPAASTPTPPATSTPPAAASQTINAFTIPALAVGASVNLAATATSGLNVTYVSNTPTTCTVSGHTATGVAFGTCSITASQAGNSSFLSAQAASAIVIGAQTINFTLPTLMVGEGFPLTATATSNLPIAYTSLTPSVCTVVGMTVNVISTGVGICTVQAAQSGSNQYASATPLPISTIVNAASTTVADGAVPPPVVFPQPGSMYSDSSTSIEGVYENAQGALAFVDSTNRFDYADYNGALFGQLQTSGQTWTLAGSSIYYAYLPVANDHTAIAATGNGTFITKQSFTATTQSFIPSPSPLSLTYDAANRYAISQSSLVGNWIDNTDTVQIQISINSAGVITGSLTGIDTSTTPSNSFICALNGSIGLADGNTSHNLLRLFINGSTITNSGTSCQMSANSFIGLGAIRYYRVTSNGANGLVIGLSMLSNTSDGARLDVNLIRKS